MAGNEKIWEHYCRQAAHKAGISVEEVKSRLANDTACLQISFTADANRVVEIKPSTEIELAAAVLIALAEHGIPPDIQELLVVGNPMRGIAPGAITKIIKVVKAMTREKHV